MQVQETLAGNGIVTVRTGSTAGVEVWSPVPPGLAATEWCHELEPNHIDLMSHGWHSQIEMCRQVPSLSLDSVWWPLWVMCDHVSSWFKTLSVAQKSAWTARHNVYIHKSSGNTNRRTLQGWIERKSRSNTRAHFTSTGVAKKEYCMNDSKNFQDIESICSGKLSHVPSHPTTVPSPRAMSSRDQSLRLVTSNLSGTHGNPFGNPRAVIDSSQTPYQEILHSWNLRVTGGNLVRDSTGRPVAKSEEQFRGTIPLPSFGRRPSPAEGPQNYTVVQQRLQISELHVDKFTTPSTFSCWKKKIKTQVSSCSDFLSEVVLWINEMEMVESMDDLKSSRSIQGYIHFPNFEMLDARTASALNKTIQNANFRKKSVWRNGKLRKKIGSFAEDRSLTWFTTTSGSLALMIPFLITLIYSQSLFATTSFRNPIRDDEILLSMTKIPPDDVLESLYKTRTREFDQFKTVLELYDMEIHQKISMPDNQKLKRWWRETWIRNFDSEIFTPKMRGLKQVQWWRVAGH